MDRFGRIDILCQNAGIYPYTMLPDISVEEWDEVLAVNLRGTFLAIPGRSPADGEATLRPDRGHLVDLVPARA